MSELQLCDCGKVLIKTFQKERSKAQEFPARLFTFLHCLRQKYIISLVHSIFIFLSDFLIKKPSTFMVFDCFVDK